MSLDGDPLETFRAGEPPPDADRGSDEYRAWRDRQRRADEHWALRVPVLAGPRTLRATFRKKTSAYPETLRQPYLRPYTNTTGGDTRHQPYLASVVITGPYEASDAPPTEETPSRARIFTCRPAEGDAAEARACASEILSTLARRAYRRPVIARDLDVLLDFYDRGSAGGFEAGVELALRRLLVSPEFLFRVVRDPVGLAPATPLPAERPGAGVAAVVLPLEQHPRRRAHRFSRRRAACATRPCSRRRSAACWPTSGRRR